MLKQDDCIDLIIPRGSKEFVRYIMDNSNIPVLGHADGVCHVYVDAKADLDMALKVTLDSKAYRFSVCNTAETLLVHADCAKDFLPVAAVALKTKNVEIRGDDTAFALIECKHAAEEDWAAEYLDAILSVKVVASLDEAIDHINHYGSGHTDCIVSRDSAAIERFMALTWTARMSSPTAPRSWRTGLCSGWARRWASPPASCTPGARWAWKACAPINTSFTERDIPWPISTTAKRRSFTENWTNS